MTARIMLSGTGDGNNDDNILYGGDDRPRLSSLFVVQTFFLRIMGLFYKDDLSVWLPIRLRKAQAILWVAVSGHIALFFIKTTFDALHEHSSLQDISNALSRTIIYTFSCFTVSYWLWRSQELKDLLHRIDRGHRHHSLAGLTFVNSHRAFVLARNLTISYLSICFMGAVLLPPIIHGSYTLPLKCWYPFDEKQPIVYPFVIATQIIGQIILASAFGNGLTLYVSLIIVMMGQFDVLFCSLKNFDHHARLLSGEDLQSLRRVQNNLLMDEDGELNQYAYATEYKTDLTLFGNSIKKKRNFSRNSLNERWRHEALVKCIQHHRFIMDCCEELERLFSPYCLIKSLQITMVLCLLLFVYTKGLEGGNSVTGVVNLIEYVGLTIFELVFFTYFGELLHNHSVRGGEALWRSEWWNGAKHTRQVIMIFLLNSRRGVKLTAGKFFLMDVQRFKSVMTQAFSFFSLLQKLADKDRKREETEG